MKQPAKKILSVLLIIAMLISTGMMTTISSATMVSIPDDAAEFNGNYYKIFNDNKTWTDAKSYCESLGGHLVTITSAQEQTFIEILMKNAERKMYWIGLTAINKKPEWITGETYEYSNWAECLPDNMCEGEQYGHIYAQNHISEGQIIQKIGQWNDLTDKGTSDAQSDREFYLLRNIGYICEWDVGINEQGGLFSADYGWRIPNDELAFGYSNSYRIPFERYNEVYGISVSSLLNSGIKSIGKWGGNCFGLALLSLFEYYNKLDIAGYFQFSGNNLYDYGYESIETTDSGQQYYSIAANKEVISLIERAFVSQNSVEFAECEIFSGDSDFSELIAHFSQKNASPIMAGFFSGMTGHAVILTSDEIATNIDGTDWISICMCDSNAPYNDESLNNPIRDYKFGKSYLLVNPKTKEWRYYANGKVQFGNSYYAVDQFTMLGNWSGQSIYLYDISQLPDSYLTKTLNVWHKHVQIDLSGSDITIKNKNDDILLEIKDNSIVRIAENCDYKYQYGDSSSIQCQLGTFYTDDTSELTITSSNIELFAISGDFYCSASIENDSEMSIDMKSGLISAVNMSKDANSVNLNIQNVNMSYAVNVSSSLNVTDSVFLDGSKSYIDITTNKNSDEIDIKTEGISKENVNIKTHVDSDFNGICDLCKAELTKNCSHLCHKDNAFMQFIWKIINFLSKIFGASEYCDCGMKHW